MNQTGSEQSAEAPYRPVGPARRRRSSNALQQRLHRALLWVVLAVGAAALTYNAVSIVSGEGGLASLSATFEDHPPLISVAAANRDGAGR